MPIYVMFVKCVEASDVDGDVAKVKVWKLILFESVIEYVTRDMILNVGERKW
jgi:hypothetical protein